MLSKHIVAYRLKKQEQFAHLMTLPWEDFIKCVGTSEKKLIIRRLIHDQEGRCGNCHGFEWCNHPIPLELEHKDGNHHNDDLNNLVLLCPNCHALTPTWRGRNKTRRRATDDQMIDAFREIGIIRQGLIILWLAA